MLDCACQRTVDERGRKPMRKATKARFDTLPTATGGIARAAYAQAINARLDVSAASCARGIECPAGQGSPRRIGVGNQIKFLNLAADALPDEFLGIRLAQGLDLRELGLLYYVQASSDTLGDALRRAARYSYVTHNEGVRLRYRERNGISIAFEYVGVARLGDRHQIEFFVTTLVRICRHLTGHHLLPSGIKLMHRRVEMPSELRALFGCDVAIRQRCRRGCIPGIDRAHAPRQRGSVPQHAAGEILRRSAFESSHEVECLAIECRERHGPAVAAWSGARCRDCPATRCQPADAGAPACIRRPDICRSSRWPAIRPRQALFAGIGLADVQSRVAARLSGNQRIQSRIQAMDRQDTGQMRLSRTCQSAAAAVLEGSLRPPIRKPYALGQNILFLLRTPPGLGFCQQ